MKIQIIFILLYLTNSKSLVQILGMGYLLDGLAISQPTLDQFNNTSTGYMLDPNINIFLTQFTTRTQLCDYKCPNMFNLPCFLLFGCNIHIRNFILIFFLPFLMITFAAICFKKRIWTFGCFLKYVTVFTGITFILWIFWKCKQGGKIRQRKQRQKIQHLNKLKNQQNQNVYQIQPAETACRLSIAKQISTQKQNNNI